MAAPMPALEDLYARLLAAYGPQGWWPTPSRAGRRGFDARGYHPGDFLQPRSPRGRFEVVLGAVLTQNTAWTNVEKALDRLRDAGIRMPADVRSCPSARLARAHPCLGLLQPEGEEAEGDRRPDRGEQRAHAASCFSADGAIGPETADSILLYAFHQPLFVIDAYTRRILARIGIIGGTESYEEIQRIFHDALPPRHELFNEFHALLVEHAKVHCRARPVCGGCPVDVCRYRDSPST